MGHKPFAESAGSDILIPIIASTWMGMDNDWLGIYEDLRCKLGLREKHVLDLGPEKRELFTRATDALRERFVLQVMEEREVEEARLWIRELEECVSSLREKLGVDGVLYTRELGSFLADPLAHLKKKIFIYTFDLLSGKMDIEVFERKASAAVRTSFRTNMRSIYQTWVFLKLLDILSSYGPSRLLYPEHGHLHVERSGRQRLGFIPPNCVVQVPPGVLSFFIEVPRPVAWEDTHDLAKVWKFYVALRPDMMVYGGKVMDIADPSRDPPVKRPDFIVECKELADWYERVRDLRGRFSKPLSAVEWRFLWLKGLWDGLAAAMGVGRKEVIRMLREEKAVRLKEPRLVQLYKNVYKPGKMALVSRAPLPGEVRDELEGSGILIYDGVGFRGDKLEELALELASIAKPVGPGDFLSEVAELLGLRGIDRGLLREALMELVLENLDILRRKLAENPLRRGEGDD